MKQIDKNELYQNLRGFLKSKGIELQDGSYANRVRQGCGLLADAVNATQKTVRRARVEVDRKLDQLRQSIHNATASEPVVSSASKPAPANEPTRGKRKARPKASAARAKRRRR